MRRNRRIPSLPFHFIAAAAILIIAAASCAEDRRIGGCEIETIKVGGSYGTVQSGPLDALRIGINAVPYPGKELYRQAADELEALLDSADIEVFSRSEIIHIADGPCWPPYTLTFKTAPLSSATDTLHAWLLATPIAGYTPYAERDTYGKFFITCVKWSSDLWTVWYR